MTRIVSAARLRPRLVVTFALVAAFTAAGVAVTSYYITREAVLRRAESVARREGQAVLANAAETLPTTPSRAQVAELVARLKAAAGAAFDVVVVYDDGSFDTTSISLSAESVPAALIGPVRSGRVALMRASASGDPFVVVGGRPAGMPALYLFFPLEDVTEDLELLRNVLAAAGAVAVLLSAFVGAVAARGLLRPLRQARTAAHRLEVGLLGTRLPEGGGDEFADLGHAFNRMAEALERSMGALRELEGSHRRFVADVSHELRTPLTALTTAADVLEAHSAGLDEAGRRAARLLVRETRRLATLVEDLMEISRLDAGAAPMAWERVDVVQLVASAVSTRGWDRQVRVEGDSATTVVDPRRLDAIVVNLVGNALEHGAPPVRVRVSATEGEVVVEVADAGPGIAEEHLSRVFDRFYKADPARPGGRGSGLGLAIARENARLHGGDLTVSSPPGSGATFTLRLPRRVAEPLPPGDRPVTTARHDAVT
ncbi:MAG: HAMP domain-containing histidine kinase [Actinomycetota bacterium]|nr:HAMP domain-containing histidine kinase [Actinomycetota bacterium]